MKTSKHTYILVFGLLIFLIACSTKRDRFLNRNFQALNTKYNVLYHGTVAFDKGVAELKFKYKDNFWEILPVERQLPPEVKAKPGTAEPKPTETAPPVVNNNPSKDNAPLGIPGKDTKAPNTPLAAAGKNGNFERAEDKATRAIQKRSMNFGGTERNSQIDEAYLLLGKTRYYDQRYIPALEAFNYILYKYPSSNKIYEAKVWREKTNIRLDNDEVAIVNLSKLLKEIKFKNQIFADANAILAQAFLKTELKDSAVYRLKLATEFTKEKEEKARYRFITGQIYEELGYKDSAYASYQEVINMKRKAPRQYVIHSEIRQAQQFDYQKGDSIAFLKKFRDFLKDRENRPFLADINHQLALYYDKGKNNKQAKIFYNKSLKSKSSDSYLVASNYRNLADIYFNTSKYITAGKYYDSTLTKLTPKTNEFRLITKKRENLDDVIKYETIAHDNDSILKILAMNKKEKTKYFEDYIAQLIKDEKAKKLKEAKAKEIADSDKNTFNGEDPIDKPTEAASSSKRPIVSGPVFSSSTALGSGTGNSTFYFYNSNTVAFGKIEFRKNWGERAYKNNWRTSSDSQFGKEDSSLDESTTNDNSVFKDPKTEPKYTTDFYLSKLPKKQDEIETLIKDRNFAYYQLGVVYKEKFKEYKLAQNKFETLLFENPEERLVLPAMYNLYRIYEITDTNKAKEMKDKILKLYPDSRYAQIINNASPDASSGQSPELEYKNLYKKYLTGIDLRTLIVETENAVNKYNGDEIEPKFELLKANIVGKIKGLIEYKKALNYVALSYPESAEGKNAEAFIKKEIVTMEALHFNGAPGTSWKILYPIGDDKESKAIELYKLINSFTKGRASDKITTSVDLYTMESNFIAIHGIKTEETAKEIASILKEYKDYQVKIEPILISNYNYKIVQIKKNIAEYIANPTKIATVPTIEKSNGTLKSDSKKEGFQPQESIKQDSFEKTDEVLPPTKNDGSTPSPKNKLDPTSTEDPAPESPVNPTPKK